MERVREFGIWARSELGIWHGVRRAFRTGDIRTWGRHRAVKTNRLVVGLLYLEINCDDWWYAPSCLFMSDNRLSTRIGEVRLILQQI